jgi:hypothetical protein
MYDCCGEQLYIIHAFSDVISLSVNYIGDLFLQRVHDAWAKQMLHICLLCGKVFRTHACGRDMAKLFKPLVGTQADPFVVLSGLVSK